MTINETVDKIYECIKAGKTVHCHNTAYIFVAETPYQNKTDHFSYRDGMILSVRHKENWFGSRIDTSELNFIIWPK